MKVCTKCNIEKTKDGFRKHKGKKDGLSSQCKSCVSRNDREYRDNNQEKIAAGKQQYTANNQVKITTYQQQYTANNQEKIATYNRQYYANNQEKIVDCSRQYRVNNTDKIAAYSRNSRARKRNAYGSHTVAEIRAIFDSQLGLCANCKAKLFKSGKYKFHVDHIVPLVKGGSNDRYNLQCLCPTCNLRKNAKDPFDWAKENGRLL